MSICICAMHCTRSGYHERACCDGSACACWCHGEAMAHDADKPTAPGESLAAEVERAMCAAAGYNGEGYHITVETAARVAVELIKSERAELLGPLHGQRLEAMGWQRRAEAAEKALAERGHVAGCGCCVRCTDKLVMCEQHPYVPERDPRCTPGGERRACLQHEIASCWVCRVVNGGEK